MINESIAILKGDVLDKKKAISIALGLGVEVISICDSGERIIVSGEADDIKRLATELGSNMKVIFEDSEEFNKILNEKNINIDADKQYYELLSKTAYYHPSELYNRFMSFLKTSGYIPREYLKFIPKDHREEIENYIKDHNIKIVNGALNEETMKKINESNMDALKKIKALQIQTGLKGDALAQAAYEKWGWDVAYLINDPLSKHVFENKNTKIKSMLNLKESTIDLRIKQKLKALTEGLESEVDAETWADEEPEAPVINNEKEIEVDGEPLVDVQKDESALEYLLGAQESTEAEKAYATKATEQGSGSAH